MPANTPNAPTRRPTPQNVQAARTILGNPTTFLLANRECWHHLVQASWAVLHSDRAARLQRAKVQLINTHEGGAA